MALRLCGNPTGAMNAAYCPVGGGATGFPDAATVRRPCLTYGILTRWPEITTLKDIKVGVYPANAGPTLSESA
jgi:hypothetical protein